MVETDGGNEFLNEVFTDFLNESNIKRYSRNTSLGAVFAEPFNGIIGDIFKRAVFLKGGGNWIDVLPTITRHYNNRTHWST